MTVSYTALFLMLFPVFFIICITGLPAAETRVRLKRELSDDDIVLGLKMYESKLSRMQSRIAKQMNVMNKQKRRIDDLKYYLKHKGDDYEADDLQGEIALKAAEAIKELQFASLESLGRGTEHEEEGQRDLLAAIKKENKVISDILLRVLDNRLICRDTETDWAGKASGLIKDLTNHYVQCRANELLQRFYLERKDASWNSKVRYKYRCCQMSMTKNWKKPENM